MNIKRSHIIIVAILILVLIAVSLLFNRSSTGVLELTTPSKTPNNAEVAISIMRDGVEEEAFTLRPGESRSLRIKTGTVRVDGWADTLKAVDVVEIKSFTTTTLKTPSAEQRAAQQIASDAKYCPVVVANITYSYGCDGEGPITKHDSNSLGSSLNTTLFDGLSFSNMLPVKNGLIGYFATVGLATDLQYVNLVTHTITKVSLPEDVQELMDEQPELTATADPTSQKFGLLFGEKGKIYVFDDIKDTNPTEIKPGKNLRINQEGRRVRLGFDSKGQPVLFAGTTTDLREGEVISETSQEASTSELDAYLFEYDHAGKLQHTLTVPEGIDAQNIYKLGSGFYAAEQSRGFGFFQGEDGELKHTYDVPEMSSWTVIGDKAYVVTGGTLYEFSPGKNGLFSLRGLFNSTTITVSSLFRGPDGILFTGLTNTQENPPLNIYRLLEKGEKPAAGNSQQVRGAPTITGLDDLIYYGISSFQADNLRYALGDYAAKSPTEIQIIDITSLEAAPHNPDSTVQTIRFGLSINNEPALKAKMDYYDLSAIHLYLLNPGTGAVVYDSKEINHKEPPSYNPEPQH